MVKFERSARREAGQDDGVIEVGWNPSCTTFHCSPPTLSPSPRFTLFHCYYICLKPSSAFPKYPSSSSLSAPSPTLPHGGVKTRSLDSTRGKKLTSKDPNLNFLVRKKPPKLYPEDGSKPSSRSSRRGWRSKQTRCESKGEKISRNPSRRGREMVRVF